MGYHLKLYHSIFHIAIFPSLQVAIFPYKYFWGQVRQTFNFIFLPWFMKNLLERASFSLWQVRLPVHPRARLIKSYKLSLAAGILAEPGAGVVRIWKPQLPFEAEFPWRKVSSPGWPASLLSVSQYQTQPGKRSAEASDTDTFAISTVLKAKDYKEPSSHAVSESVFSGKTWAWNRLVTGEPQTWQWYS